MSDLIISSRQNNIVKYVRGLREKRNRDKEGCFLVEGVKSVKEAVSAGETIRKLLITERGEKHFQLNDITTNLSKEVQIVRVTDEVMEFMSEIESPQGIIALVSKSQITLKELTVTQSSGFVVIDGVQDPGNVGTIIRSADAFGFGAVILTKGCADIFNSKTLRSTMGSVFHLPVIQDVTTEDLINFLKENSFFIAATTLEESSRFLPDVEFLRPLALVFGNEGKGVSKEISSSADVLVKVPMFGSAESLNVAVTSGIVLYEASRRHGSSPNQTCK